jgi:hypothetical protein
VLETSVEKMKINDPGNSECFCDIEPKQPLHRSRINRVPFTWSRRCSLSVSKQSIQITFGKGTFDLAGKWQN